MEIFIEESGMNFGPFSNENFFYVEKSKVYEKHRQGLKMAEFVLFVPEKNNCLVVEAKSSSPNPHNHGSADRFHSFMDEIYDKLLNALTLVFTFNLGRHKDSEEELPEGIKNMPMGSARIILVLIIKDHKQEWLVPVNDALKRKFNAGIKTWPLDVIVINEQIAQKYKLVK